MQLLFHISSLSVQVRFKKRAFLCLHSLPLLSYRTFCSTNERISLYLLIYYYFKLIFIFSITIYSPMPSSTSTHPCFPLQLPYCCPFSWVLSFYFSFFAISLVIYFFHCIVFGDYMNNVYKKHVSFLYSALYTEIAQEMLLLLFPSILSIPKTLSWIPGLLDLSNWCLVDTCWKAWIHLISFLSFLSVISGSQSTKRSSSTIQTWYSSETGSMPVL